MSLWALSGCALIGSTSGPQTSTATTSSSSSSGQARSKKVEVTRFGRLGDYLALEIRNPNTDVGLIRERFSAAAIGKDGSVIGTFGSQGVPGAFCCTIYQLPPGSKYGFEFQLAQGAPEVASVEFTLPSPKWVKWSDTHAATAKAISPSLKVGEFSTSMTGRVSVDKEGPFNVTVVGFLESAGQLVGLVGDVVDCITNGSPRAFEVKYLGGDLKGGATVTDVVAYPTTVPGYGDTQKPPGC